ncbi:MAG: flippase-like domain-containing protein [Chloroflexota bacterium]|nr:flippase-like domain-containing protein [Chloroflexota bacterium]
MRSWRFALGLLISAIFLVYAFRGQDYGAIVDSLRGVNYLLLIPALGLYLLGVVARAYRWSILLGPIKPISTRKLLPITAIGFMANNVLPLRTGEVVRSFVLSRNHGIRKTSALATIAVERIFDGLTMVGFMLVAAMTVDFTSDIRHVMTLAVILFAIAVAGLAIMTFAEGLRITLLKFVLRLMPAAIGNKVQILAEAFFSGLGSLRSPKALAAVGLSSILAWSLEASMYFVIARAFGGSVREVMGFSETLLTTGVANLATLVPSSPGYVGPFEAGVKTALSGAHSVPEAQALSYAILVHAALWFPITLWGAIEWSRQHLSLKQATSGDPAPAPPRTRGGTHSETSTRAESVTHSNAA